MASKTKEAAKKAAPVSAAVGAVGANDSKALIPVSEFGSF